MKNAPKISRIASIRFSSYGGIDVIIVSYRYFQLQSRICFPHDLQGPGPGGAVDPVFIHMMDAPLQCVQHPFLLHGLCGHDPGVGAP